MKRKTTRIYSTTYLDGTDVMSTIKSLSELVGGLKSKAEAEGREPLFDTLEIGVEREAISEMTLTQGVASVETYITLTASLEAVSRNTTQKEGNTND